ncbi:GPI ethanolamine phosphate transferase 1-like [Drosophila miranda]|uniref:GPI ethanolamine phosphate transferase 1-like n=1 Tax=Drosophila miranda TaxID=7229 RepID=UPI00143F1D90|nr:GPI ethanolamine phosphate transferase 1-like [Drosophila miranda]
MCIVYALVVHVLLLGSIFVIYFRSPVINGLKPHTPFIGYGLEAPANRMVLIVTDGLRAASFFEDNCRHVPHLREIFMREGLVGISRTLLKCWKENPIDFDTVLNRCGHSYSWGAPDILNIFQKLAGENDPRMYFDAYSHDMDFSGKHKTYELDEWVFRQVRFLLNRKKDELRKYQPKTVYLLTSDHGMTDSGSHESGAPHETETPFMLWGAGVSRIASTVGARKFVANDEGLQLPLHELEQAQLTPLMSVLVGLPPPMNNLGTLPTGYMAVSEEYKAMAAHSNALQLLAQYEKLLEQHRQGFFADFLNNFDQLSPEDDYMF